MSEFVQTSSGLSAILKRQAFSFDRRQIVRKRKASSIYHKDKKPSQLIFLFFSVVYWLAMTCGQQPLSGVGY
jgi:hypothetical protein